MKRKLVQQGGSALTVTLPAKWCKANNLKAGDEVEFSDDSSNLLTIKGKGEESKKEYKLTIIEDEITDSRFFEAHMNSLYINGYNKIILELPDKKYLKILQKYVKNNLLGDL